MTFIDGYADAATHARFLDDLERSAEAVVRMAMFFVLNGQDVVIKGIKRAPSHAEHRQYRDSGDLYVKDADGKWRRTEVKHLKYAFTSGDDWPFPRFIVCSRYKWDNASPKPHEFYILSWDMRHAAVCCGYTAADWTTYTTTPHNSTREETFWVCPIELIKFIDLKVPVT